MKNAADKHRKRSSALLGTLVAMHNGKCYWCGRAVVHLKALPSDAIVTVDRDWVYFVADSILVRGTVATVDHILPIDMGGTSHIQNLVPSCERCNEFRNTHKGLALSYADTCPGIKDRCGNQLRRNKTHCKSCWRKLVRVERPELPDEIEYRGIKYRLVA